MRCFTLASVPLVIVDEPDLLEPAAIDVGLFDNLMEMSGDEGRDEGGSAGSAGGSGGNSSGYGSIPAHYVGGGGGASPCPYPPVSPVPEPASWAHLIGGLALCGWSIRFRGRKMA
jgi:hypothetical protein